MDADFWEQMNPRFLTPPEETQTPATDDPYPNVPAELKQRRQWLVWREEIRRDKTTKVPYQVNEKKAQSNNASTWTDYVTVCKHQERFDGIGFVFTPGDLYTGIDLDDCIIDGKVQPWAEEIIGKFQSSAYIEVSPSRNGIKIWTRAKLLAEAKHKVYLQGNTGAAIEAYDRGRYFTVTGKGRYAIGDGQEAVNWLFEKYLKPEPQPTPTPKTTPPATPTESRTEAEIIRLIENSRQRAKFEALMQGNWQTQDYGSHSEADCGLVSLLCFWTQDARHLDAIFRKSALYRQKWDEKHRADGATYGEMTIEHALHQRREAYTPPKRRQQRRPSGKFYQSFNKRSPYR